MTTTDSHDHDLDLQPLALAEIETLDADRADRLGVHLAVAAAASTAATRTSHPVRRAVAGIAAAAVLGVGALAVTTAVGGPGDATQPASAAVSIEREDGWTKVTLLDPEADVDEIAAALDAAGITTRIESMAEGTISMGGAEITQTADGLTTVAIRKGDEDDQRGTISGIATALPQTEGDEQWTSTLAIVSTDLVAIAALSDAEAGQLAGIAVELGDPLDGIDLGDPFHTDAVDTALEERGVRGRSEQMNSVSIRDGADVEVVLYRRS